MSTLLPLCQIVLASAMRGEMSWWDLLWWNGGSTSHEPQWWHGTGWIFFSFAVITFIFLSLWYIVRRGRLPKPDQP